MREQLMLYAPSYIEALYDLKNVLLSEGEALDSLWEAIDYTNRSFYVMSCPAETLEKYEMLLGIANVEGETLEGRRARIVTRLNNKEKLSRVYLENIARAFGWGNIEILLEGKKIKIIALSKYGILPQYEIVKQTLREKLPAHITGEIIFKLWLYGEIEGEKRTYLFLEDFSHAEITNRDIENKKLVS